MDTKTTILWAMAIITAGAVLLSPVACTMRRQQLVAEAIKSGADPMAVKCAIEGDAGNTNPACIIKAMPR